jgi:hypothetical protein
MRRVRSTGFGIQSSLAVLLVLFATACGSATEGLAPIAYPDPSGVCPAGKTGWKLEVLDRRAERPNSEDVVALIGESVRRSFPGCRWDGEGDAGAGVIRVEVHRFVTTAAENTWDAAAEWTVTASDPAGATLTEFEADEEVSRPNYRGSNNAKESLQEVFDRALRRTLAGLRVVASARSSRPPGGTPGAENQLVAWEIRRATCSYTEPSVDRTSSGEGASVERFSQSSPPEVL